MRRNKAKFLDNRRAFYKTVPVGSTEPKRDTSADEALIQEAIEKGKITTVSSCKQAKIRERRPTKSW